MLSCFSSGDYLRLPEGPGFSPALLWMVTNPRLAGPSTLYRLPFALCLERDSADFVLFEVCGFCL